MDCNENFSYSLDQILKGEEPANNLPLFLLKEPGKGWLYSGGGYLLTQKVICEVCGADFKTIIKMRYYNHLE